MARRFAHKRKVEDAALAGVLVDGLLERVGIVGHPVAFGEVRGACDVDDVGMIGINDVGTLLGGTGGDQEECRAHRCRGSLFHQDVPALRRG
jgi:hypothetical protein